MPTTICTPSALAILIAARDLYLAEAPDAWTALDLAALHAPARAAVLAANAFDDASTGASVLEAFNAAIGVETARRLDLDAWLATWRSA